MVNDNKSASGVKKYTAVGSVIFMWVLFGAAIALTYAIRTWFSFANVNMLGGEFNVVMLIIGGLYYAFCAYLYSFITESDAIFGEYNPICKTLPEITNYIKRCYREADVPKGARKSVTLSLILHAALVAAMAILWDPFFFNYLLPLPLLCFGYIGPSKELKLEEEFLDDFIVARTKKKDWKSHLCPHCKAVNGTGIFLGNGNESKYTTTGVDHYTTEREYTEGSTTVHETTFHSDPFVTTHYSYDAYFQCRRCKKKYSIHHSGKDKRFI